MEQQAHVLPLTDARDLVLNFIKAVNGGDIKAARTYVAEYLEFTGTMASRKGADNYFEDVKHLELKYEIKKTFREGEDVCILYDITISGIVVFACGWYQVEGGKNKLNKSNF